MFLILAVLIGMQWYHTAVVIFISLLTHDVESFHAFIYHSFYLLQWSVYPNLLPILKIGLLGLFFLLNIFYIFYLLFKSNMWFSKFSLSPWAVFSFFHTVFQKQKLLILKKSRLPIFSFTDHAFVSYPRNLCLIQITDFSPMYT